MMPYDALSGETKRLCAHHPRLAKELVRATLEAQERASQSILKVAIHRNLGRVFALGATFGAGAGLLVQILLQVVTGAPP